MATSVFGKASSVCEHRIATYQELENIFSQLEKLKQKDKSLNNIISVSLKQSRCVSKVNVSYIAHLILTPIPDTTNTLS